MGAISLKAPQWEGSVSSFGRPHSSQVLLDSELGLPVGGLGDDGASARVAKIRGRIAELVREENEIRGGGGSTTDPVTHVPHMENVPPPAYELDSN